jgi:hypothetical protein
MTISLLNPTGKAPQVAPGMSQTDNGHLPGTPYSSNPGAATAGQGSSNYGSLTNRWRNGVIDAGSQAGQGEQNATGSRNGFLDILNQDPSQTLQAYVNGAMGDFNKSLQSQRESSVQRGIGTGDLGTAYEGSLDSAFQKNIASQAAGLYGTRLNAAQGLYAQDSSNSQNNQNRYLDALTAQSDQSQAKKNAHNSFLSGILGTVGQVAGAFAGG